MKHITKRTLLSVFLCITLLISSVVLLTSCGENMFYTENEEGTGYILTGCSKRSAKKITVPAEHEGLPVIGIGSSVFHSFGELKTVILPDSILYIEHSAFAECPMLESITLPEGLQSIGARAFGDCTKLSDINIPESVTHIDEIVFENTAIDSQTENGITYFDNWVIGADIAAEQTLVLREGTRGICVAAFGGSKKLTKADLVGDVLYICDGAFSGCEKLETVEGCDSLKIIGKSAFSGCKNLTEINLGNELKTIDNTAFKECSNLTSVSLPSTVEYIASNAFYHCPAGKNIDLSKYSNGN